MCLNLIIKGKILKIFFILCFLLVFIIVYIWDVYVCMKDLILMGMNLKEDI